MNILCVTAIHSIITPRCRSVQGGDREAFEEAVRRVLVEYDRCIQGRGPDDTADYHLVLTVEAK